MFLGSITTSPKWVIDQLLSEVQLDYSNIRSSIEDNQNDVKKQHIYQSYLMLVRKVKN